MPCSKCTRFQLEYSCQAISTLSALKSNFVRMSTVIGEYNLLCMRMAGLAAEDLQHARSYLKEVIGLVHCPLKVTRKYPNVYILHESDDLTDARLREAIRFAGIDIASKNWYIITLFKDHLEAEIMPGESYEISNLFSHGTNDNGEMKLYSTPKTTIQLQTKKN